MLLMRLLLAGGDQRREGQRSIDQSNPRGDRRIEKEERKESKEARPPSDRSNVRGEPLLLQPLVRRDETALAAECGAPAESH